MLFSANNLPPGFYHYLYLRKDGTPYYSGKGKDNRAWENHRVERNGKMAGVFSPSDPSKIVITHWGLTELWAFALERWYIRWYGRKDLGTGILRNKTDGGEGTSGRKALRPELERRYQGKSNPMYGKKRDDVVLRNQSTTGINHPVADKTIFQFVRIKDGVLEKCTSTELEKKYKLRPGCMRYICAGKGITCKGWKLFGVTVEKNKGNKNPRFNSTIFNFVNVELNITEKTTMYELRMKYSLDRGKLRYLIGGKVDIYRGWKIMEIKND